MQTQTQTHTPWALCVGRLPCNILTGLQRSCFLLSTTNPSAVCLRASQNLLEESVTGSFTALMTNSISANHVCVYLPPQKKKKLQLHPPLSRPWEKKQNNNSL